MEYFVRLRPKMYLWAAVNDLTSYCFWSKAEVLLFLKPFSSPEWHVGRCEVRLMIGGAGCHMCINNREAMKREDPEWWSFRKNTLGRKIRNGETKKLVSKTDARRHSSLCILNWRGRNVPLCQGGSHSEQHMKEGRRDKKHTICSGRPSSLAGFIGWIPRKNCWFKKDKKNPLHPWLSCVFYGFVCAHVKALHANRKTVAFQMELLDKFPVEGGQKDPKRRIIPFLPGKR